MRSNCATRGNIGMSSRNSGGSRIAIARLAEARRKPSGNFLDDAAD